MNEFAEFPMQVDHPLLVDQARLERIINNMSIQIQRKIYGGVVSANEERVLHGGVSVDDVLQEALLAVLSYDPADLNESWEALSVGIARNKAVDAVRRSTRGRRSADTGPDDPDEITVVSLTAISDNGEIEDVTIDEQGDAELEFLRAEQERYLLRLARDRLSDRDKAVYFGIHYLGRTRVDLAPEVGMSPQGVGQLYVRIAKRLLDEAGADPAFPHDEVGPEGGPHE